MLLNLKKQVKILERFKSELVKMETMNKMSVNEVKNLVSELVEEKLAEILGDPDAESELKETVVTRLKASFEAEKRGEAGTPAAEFARKLGLKW